MITENEIKRTVDKLESLTLRKKILYINPEDITQTQELCPGFLDDFDVRPTNLIKRGNIFISDEGLEVEKYEKWNIG